MAVPALLQATLLSPQALRASHGADDPRAAAAAAALAAAGAAAHAAVSDAYASRCAVVHCVAHENSKLVIARMCARHVCFCGSLAVAVLP